MRKREGSALVLTLLLTMALAALALSAIFLGSTSLMLAKNYDREREFRYAAEAALAMGKSRLNNDPDVLPDSLYATLLSNAPIVGADGIELPGIRVNLYAGPSGSTSGQFGRFASVVAEARDAGGARYVRRLELNQESFAKYAYFSNRETNNGTTIYFGNGDNLWGPVWSNDIISINSGRATFNDEVGTAQYINGVANGTFRKGYSIYQKPIALPDNSVLAKLPAYAALGGLSFLAPNTGTEKQALARLEFVALDLNMDGDSSDVDEGFVRVYIANAGNEKWLRGDYPVSGIVNDGISCGDWHMRNGALRFYPANIHNTAWFRTHMQVPAPSGPGMTATAANNEGNATLTTIMQHANSRCFPGGDPNLVAAALNGTGAPVADRERPGSDTTFYATDRYGRWLQYPGPADPRLGVLRRSDAQYLFPLHRSLNPGSKGVIYVAGTVGVSGVVRGRITLYASGNVVLLDDLRYSENPAAGRCLDMLGLIAARDIIVADNAPNTPALVGGAYRNLDDTNYLTLHGVMMAVSTAFRVEDYNTGPTNANGCGASASGRGCLFLTGGVIQESRGAVGLSTGQGFVKRYSYDRCAAIQPPPYFPTTGRFIDNRYVETDPVRFDVERLFRALTPGS